MVRDQAQARELDMAWREIISGERLARTEALEHDIQSIMDQAQEALQTIETGSCENPKSGQAGRLIRFIAGDRLGKREVHRHLKGGQGSTASPAQ